MTARPRLTAWDRGAFETRDRVAAWAEECRHEARVARVMAAHVLDPARADPRDLETRLDLAERWLAYAETMRRNADGEDRRAAMLTVWIASRSAYRAEVNSRRRRRA